MDRFSKAAGIVLREARLRRGLTLYDVARLSDGRFKPSSVGGYERGERALSLDRFCDLAALYGVSADRVLSEALASVDPEGRDEVLIDLNRLSMVEEEDRLLVAEFVHRIKSQRQDYLTDVVTLRAGDVAALALAAGKRPGSLLSRLRPAIREDDPPIQ